MTFYKDENLGQHPDLDPAVILFVCLFSDTLNTQGTKEGKNLVSNNLTDDAVVVK